MRGRTDAAHRATVSRAAQLLDDLMPPPDAAPEFRAPGPMRLALLRARGGIDLPPFSGLQSFVAAIARFAPEDRSAALRELYARWQVAARGKPRQSPRRLPLRRRRCCRCARPAPNCAS